MKKRIISLILSTAMTFQVASIAVFATNSTTDSNKLYSDAFNSVVNCQKQRTQTSVNSAREKINLLFNTGASWSIGEFSKQVDQIQHPILVKIVDNIKQCEKNPVQKIIEETRLLISPLPVVVWRNSYSSALDRCQQNLVNKMVSFYKQFEKDKSDSSKKSCQSLINELKTSSSSDVVKVASDFEEKLNKVVVVPDVKPTEIVKFEDKNFENVIRNQINKPSGDITSADVSSIESVLVKGVDIASLKGIESFTGLKSLIFEPVFDAVNNKGYDCSSLKDISPIKNLKNLEVLNFSGTRDIDCKDSLDNLVNLKELHLGSNVYREPDFLSNLTNLRILDYMYFGGGEHPDKYLSFDSDKLKSLVNLEELTIKPFKGEDLSFTNNFKNLKSLYIPYCDVKSLNNLNKNVTTLSLMKGSVKDFSSIKNCTNIENLSLIFVSNLPEVDAFPNFRNLKIIDLSGTGCSESYISRLKSKYPNAEIIKLF